MVYHRYVFVVRIWFEPDQIDDRPALQLRGSIERVATDDRRYFASLDELLRLLAAMIWAEKTDPR